MDLKTFICTASGLIGGFFISLFGGWSGEMTTLIILMIADFISGWIVAGCFQRSSKTDSGALESKAGWKGLSKKCMTLVFVLVAHRIDLIAGTDFIQSAVCIGFVVNELLSLVENAGLMGLKYPAALTKAIQLLQDKVDKGAE